MDATLHENSKPVVSGCLYPIIPCEEIVELLQELGISLSMAELKEPLRHKEKFRQTFLALLATFSGKTEEDFEAPLSVAYAKEQWSDGLHLVNYSEAAIFRDLVELLEKCFVKDFHLRDYLQPSRKRLQEQLSAIINLAKYYEQEMGIFTTLSEPRLEIYKNLDEVALEHDELREEEHALQIQVDQVREEMEAVLMDCQQLEVEIAQSNKVQLAIRDQADLLKKQATNLKDELDTTSLTLQETAMELEKWKSQVVNSPERKKKIVDEKTLELEAAKEELKNMEQTQSQSKEGKHMDRNLLQEFEKLQAENIMLDLVKGAEKVASQIRDDQAKLEHAEHQNNMENQELANAERAFHRQEDLVASEQKRQQLKIAAAQETFETVTSQLLRVEKERREAMARTEQWEREVRELELLLEQEQEKSDREIRNMISQYKRVERAFLEKNKRRMAALGITTD